MTTAELPPPRRVRALSIAGTDPTGGAGIQADLKSFAAHGAYGMAVVTALVAQNTHGVRAVHLPDVEFLRAQLDSVSDDVVIDAVKIGMLATAEIATTVAAWLDRERAAGHRPVVVLDPVMVATSGHRLLAPEAEAAVRALVVRADLVTPNLPELAVLVDEPVATSWPAALDQARRLAERSHVTVLVKGGHLSGPTSPDAVVDPRGGVVELASPRVPTTSTHGTGCSLSAAVAALRPVRPDWPGTVREAKQWLTGAIAAGEALQVGSGHGPVDHLHHLPGLDGRPFTDELWHRVAALRDACDDLPFVRRLADGTLPLVAFEEYVRQDALYLPQYSRVLSRASSLAPDQAAQSFFARGAHACLEVERRLHEERLAASGGVNGGASGGVDGGVASPQTTAYVNHLLATAAAGSYAEVVAAVLPCYWMYADIGARLAARAGDLAAHPYGDWIGTYGDPGFVELASQARAFVDAAAAEHGPGTRARMAAAFVTSCEHELAFFAQAQRLLPAAQGADGAPTARAVAADRPGTFAPVGAA
jgi:hydroxymethylpyrimidine/phosphomethylpyrimidine kinase